MPPASSLEPAVGPGAWLATAVPMTPPFFPTQCVSRNGFCFSGQGLRGKEGEGKGTTSSVFVAGTAVIWCQVPLGCGGGSSRDQFDRFSRNPPSGTFAPLSSICPLHMDSGSVCPSKQSLSEEALRIHVQVRTDTEAGSLHQAPGKQVSVPTQLSPNTAKLAAPPKAPL